MSEPKPEVVTRALVQDVQLPADGGTLALITLDNGHDHTKPNTFGLEGMAGLSAAVATLQQRAEAGEIVAVAVTGKPFIFAVGADLSGVPGVASREQALEIARAGHAAYAAVMDLPVPTFAFVNGAAMGGGVELSLACDYRTMSKAVPAIALPEVFLGLVPGWGGCYLLPRLVGPEKALKVIVENPLNTNRMLNGPAAAKLGLADALLDGADFLEQSIIWAAGVLSGETTVEREPVNDDAAVWEAAAAAATQLADAKTAGKSPSPYRAIELVTAARTAERDAAFAREWVQQRRSLRALGDEALRRERVRSLMHLKLNPNKDYDAERYDDEIGQHLEDSNMDSEALYEELVTEVTEKLDGDDDVDFDKEEFEKQNQDDHTYYVEREGVEHDRSPEEIEKWIEETGAIGDPEEDDESSEAESSQK